MSTTNEITQLAAQQDALFKFSGAAEVASVGGSAKVRDAAMSILTGMSNHSLDAAKTVAGGLVATAAIGMTDAGTAGVAVLATTVAGVLSSKPGWKFR